MQKEVDLLGLTLHRVQAFDVLVLWKQSYGFKSLLKLGCCEPGRAFSLQGVSLLSPYCCCCSVLSSCRVRGCLRTLISSWLVFWEADLVSHGNRQNQGSESPNHCVKTTELSIGTVVCSAGPCGRPSRNVHVSPALLQLSFNCLGSRGPCPARTEKVVRVVLVPEN